jgi:hypothetical protein
MSEQMTLFIGLINAGLTVVTLADSQSYSKTTINTDLSKLMRIAGGHQRRLRPRGLRRSPLPAFEAESRAKVQPVHAIAGEFPIHQVPGMHQLKGRVHVHRCLCQIIVFTHADDVGVLELFVEQGIGIRAVAVVGSPVFGCGGRQLW